VIEVGHHHLVLDMAQVTFCDSQGMAVLVYLWRRLHDRDGRLVLAGLSAGFAKTWHLSGLHQVIATYSTVSEALAPGEQAGRDSR
jgi:anti-sigma B factor antagonist